MLCISSMDWSMHWVVAMPSYIATTTPGVVRVQRWCKLCGDGLALGSGIKPCNKSIMLSST